MHALRLLVNLSCDDVTIPSLLAAQVSDGPISLFHASGLISDGVPIIIGHEHQLTVIFPPCHIFHSGSVRLFVSNDFESASSCVETRTDSGRLTSQLVTSVTKY